jgi:hypothetical protein
MFVLLPPTDLLHDIKRRSGRTARRRDGPQLAEARRYEPDSLVICASHVSPTARHTGGHAGRGSCSATASKDVPKKPNGSIVYYPFPVKFLSILQSNEFLDVLWWVPDGDAFCIIEHGFTTRVLQIHFQALAAVVPRIDREASQA